MFGSLTPADFVVDGLFLPNRREEDGDDDDDDAAGSMKSVKARTSEISFSTCLVIPFNIFENPLSLKRLDDDEG